MHLRFSRVAALAALLALVLAWVVPAIAAPTSTQQAQFAARMRALKKVYVMREARQRIGSARALAYQKKHGRLPKGYKLEHEREGEPRDADFEEHVRVAMDKLANTTPVVTVFPSNKRVNNPATDTPPGPSNNFLGSGQSETSVAAYGNNILITWNDGEGFNTFTPGNYQLMGYGYSTDGGATWTDGGRLPIPATNPNWMWISDPMVTVNDTNGDFWFSGLVYPSGPPDFGGNLNGVAVMKGTFAGSVFTWSTAKLCFSANNGVNAYDKQWLAVNPANGNLYLCYTDFTLLGDQIEFRRSSDSNVTWSAPQTMSGASDNGYVQGSRVAVGTSGEVYVVWQALGPISQDYFKFKKSTNNGTSFGTEVVAASYYANFSSGAPGFNRERGITYPSMTVDRTNGPNRGRIYLAWNESINYFDDLLGLTSGNVTEPEGVLASGVNDTPGNAILFTPGNKLRGWIGNANDFDFFKFTATQGKSYVFFVDSLDNSLDMAFRLLCSDGTTRLAVSSPGAGFNNLIVWTAPANGTYYLRPAAWSGGGYYSIQTFVHTATGAPGRDQRDIFVNYSNTGNDLTWSNPVLVNDDSPWFDNWLPEIAVTGNSRVFCTWFDFRDSSPGSCGGQSNLYLYRSDNGGTSWINLGRITDATSDWTNTTSNIAPNQGDYVALFANYNGVYPVWGDGRDGDPNVYTVVIPTATPTLASLANSVVEPDRVELTWSATDYASQTATLERRGSSGLWTTLGDKAVDGTGLVRFIDATVAAGQGYSYRLAFGATDSRTYSSEAQITVPVGPAFALEGARPNPAERDLWISFSLPSSTPATLSLVDIAGRVVSHRDVGGLGAGSHRLNLGDGQSLSAGVYVVVLRQGERTLTQRVSVVR
jgi:hypothetical protein